MKTTTTSNSPQKCWIFEKGRYILKGGILPELPYVNLEYEAILKSNGIPYQKTLKVSDSILFPGLKEVCEYWNPEVFKEKEITLPLFAKMPDGSYLYCKKNYSSNVFTDETIEAARETEKFVEQEVIGYEGILHEVEVYQLAKKCLSGSIAQLSYKPGLSIYPIEDIEMNHDRFKIFRLHNSDWIAIFDMNKIVPNGYLTLQVPKHIAGAIIGKGGFNINSWARDLKVKKIQVIPI